LCGKNVRLPELIIYVNVRRTVFVNARERGELSVLARKTSSD